MRPFEMGGSSVCSPAFPMGTCPLFVTLSANLFVLFRIDRGAGCIPHPLIRHGISADYCLCALRFQCTRAVRTKRIVLVRSHQTQQCTHRMFCSQDCRTTPPFKPQHISKNHRPRNDRDEKVEEGLVFSGSNAKRASRGSDGRVTTSSSTVVSTRRLTERPPWNSKPAPLRSGP